MQSPEGLENTPFKLQSCNDLDMLGIRGEALVTCFLYNSVEILDPYGT